MDNLKLPAYPRYYEGMSSDAYADNAGFTKLELASLMIAQGMIASGKWNAEDFHRKPYDADGHSAGFTYAVLNAKAVIEEANK